MNDFRPEDMAAYRREPVADNASMDSDRADIFLSDENPNQIVTFAPKERFRLGYFDVMCLVINRMIGEFATEFGFGFPGSVVVDLSFFHCRVERGHAPSEEEPDATHQDASAGIAAPSRVR